MQNNNTGFDLVEAYRRTLAQHAAAREAEATRLATILQGDDRDRRRQMAQEATAVAPVKPDPKLLDDMTDDEWNEEIFG